MKRFFFTILLVSVVVMGSGCTTFHEYIVENGIGQYYVPTTYVRYQPIRVQTYYAGSSTGGRVVPVGGWSGGHYHHHDHHHDGHERGRHH